MAARYVAAHGMGGSVSDAYEPGATMTHESEAWFTGRIVHGVYPMREGENNAVESDAMRPDPPRPGRSRSARPKHGVDGTVVIRFPSRSALMAPHDLEIPEWRRRILARIFGTLDVPSPPRTEPA